MISNKHKLTELHYHEALDRASILLDGIDRNLIQHPVVKLDKEVAKLVEEAANKMAEVYQLLGDRSWTQFP